MDLQVLKTELTTDPLGRGYAGMSDEQAATSLNTANRQPFRETLTGGMIAASVVLSELAALTPENQNYVIALFGAGEMPLTDNLKSELSAVFPNPSNTRTNLIALLKRPGSRAEELRLGTVTTSNVADAKRLP